MLKVRKEIFMEYDYEFDDFVDLMHDLIEEGVYGE